MRRPLAIAVAIVLTGSLLSACGTSDYCKSVEANVESLNGFGATRTNAAYENYAKTVAALARLAPDKVSKDYSVLAEQTRGVVAAHEKVGMSLEALAADPNKVKDLSSAQRELLNTAYKAFNDATAERGAAIVTNVKQECGITLK